MLDVKTTSLDGILDYPSHKVTNESSSARFQLLFVLRAAWKPSVMDWDTLLEYFPSRGRSFTLRDASQSLADFLNGIHFVLTGVVLANTEPLQGSHSIIAGRAQSMEATSCSACSLFCNILHSHSTECNFRARFALACSPNHGTPPFRDRDDATIIGIIGSW